MTHRGSFCWKHRMSYAGWWGSRPCLFPKHKGIPRVPRLTSDSRGWLKREKPFSLPVQLYVEMYVLRDVELEKEDVLFFSVVFIKSVTWAESVENKTFQKKRGLSPCFPCLFLSKWLNTLRELCRISGRQKKKKQQDNASTEYEVGWKGRVISLSERRITLDPLLLLIIMLTCQYKCILSSSWKFHVVVIEV